MDPTDIAPARGSSLGFEAEKQIDKLDRKEAKKARRQARQRQAQAQAVGTSAASSQRAIRSTRESGSAQIERTPAPARIDRPARRPAYQIPIPGPSTVGPPPLAASASSSSDSDPNTVPIDLRVAVEHILPGELVPPITRQGPSSTARRSIYTDPPTLILDLFGPAGSGPPPNIPIPPVPTPHDTVRPDSERGKQKIRQIECIHANPLKDKGFKIAWLENYANGESNISGIERPDYMQPGFLAAPCPPGDIARVRLVESLLAQDVWKSHRWLKDALTRINANNHTRGASVSSVTQTAQIVHCFSGKVGFFPEIERSMSIDAHTILTPNYFHIRNARVDWRFKMNALVHGEPKVVLYVGVPIIIQRQSVGVVSAFSSEESGEHVPLALLRELKRLAERLRDNISKLLASNPNNKSIPTEEYRRETYFANPFPTNTLYPYRGVNLEVMHELCTWDPAAIIDYLVDSRNSSDMWLNLVYLISDVLGIESVAVIEVGLQSSSPLPDNWWAYESGHDLSAVPEVGRPKTSEHYDHFIYKTIHAQMGDEPSYHPRVYFLAAYSLNGLFIKSPERAVVYPFLRDKQTIHYRHDRKREQIELGKDTVEDKSIIKSEQFYLTRETTDAKKIAQRATLVSRRVYVRSEAHLIIAKSPSLSKTDIAFIHKAADCAIEAIQIINSR